MSSNSDFQIKDGVLIKYTGTGKKAVLPDGVTSIGGYAFYDCKSLTSITIPDSVTKIGDCAFRYCTSLTSITIPNSVTSIGKYAFDDCKSLTSITIPDSVTSIEIGAFWGCKSLTNITIPDSVTRIGKDAFAYLQAGSLRSRLHSEAARHTGLHCCQRLHLRSQMQALCFCS